MSKPKAWERARDKADEDKVVRQGARVRRLISNVSVFVMFWLYASAGASVLKAVVSGCDERWPVDLVFATKVFCPMGGK